MLFTAIAQVALAYPQFPALSTSSQYSQIIGSQPYSQGLQFPSNINSQPNTRNLGTIQGTQRLGMFTVQYGRRQANIRFQSPDQLPDGANRPECALSPNRPRPVVLVHGTFSNMNYNGATLSPLLSNEGYCVWTFNFGGPPKGAQYGLNDINQSATELKQFVDYVMQQTGASQVDLVGHSQGGFMPHLYIRDLGGARNVNKFIAMAPPNRGTDLNGLANVPGASVFISLFSSTKAGAQQTSSSDFMQNALSRPLAVPGVDYTVIITNADRTVTPWQSQQLQGARNLLVQDFCPQNAVRHADIGFDPTAVTLVLNALDPSNQREVPCVPTNSDE